MSREAIVCILAENECPKVGHEVERSGSNL